jgi:hypothetical protein
MAKDDQRDFFALDNLKKLSGACPELDFIVVMRPCTAIGVKETLHHDGVNGQKYRPSAGQSEEHRLVAGDMATRFNQGDAGE